MRVVGDTIIILLELNCTCHMKYYVHRQLGQMLWPNKRYICIDKNNTDGGSPLALDTSGVPKKNKESENDNESLQTMFSNPSTNDCPIYGRWHEVPDSWKFVISNALTLFVHIAELRKPSRTTQFQWWNTQTHPYNIQHTPI